MSPQLNLVMHLNDSALRKSLVVPAKGVPRTQQTAPALVPPPAGQRSAGRSRGKEKLAHLYRIAYPMSLVEGRKGTERAPASVFDGLRARTQGAFKALDRCAVHGTPSRTLHCESAKITADLALERYHEAARNGYGDEDGMLQDVVDLSLAMDEACSIDFIWDHKE